MPLSSYNNIVIFLYTRSFFAYPVTVVLMGELDDGWCWCWCCGWVKMFPCECVISNRYLAPCEKGEECAERCDSRLAWFYKGFFKVIQAIATSLLPKYFHDGAFRKERHQDRTKSVLCFLQPLFGIHGC